MESLQVELFGEWNRNGTELLIVLNGGDDGRHEAPQATILLTQSIVSIHQTMSLLLNTKGSTGHMHALLLRPQLSLLLLLLMLLLLLLFFIIIIIIIIYFYPRYIPQ